MQGRAAAVYGLVFLLVAVGAFAYVSVAEAPEPSLEQVDYARGEGENFTVGDREYTVSGFTTQRGEPAASLVWYDETARATEEWTHAAEPDGTTVVYEGRDHWVRIPQTADPGSFTLLETPPEDGNVSVFTDDGGNWVVDDGSEYVPLEEYEGLDRVEQQNGSSFEVGEGEESRTVTVETVTNESVTVSWNEPSETEVFVRQTDREQLNGQNVTAHFPSEGTLQLTTDEAEIDRYLAVHEDRDLFQQRSQGLTMAAILSLVSVALLVGLAFLPRKE